MDEFIVTWHPIPGHVDPVAAARFARFVDISGGRTACWPWSGARLPTGYGKFGYQGRAVMATRFSLELSLGRPLHDGMLACHTCDNPPCVNPLHLYEGSVHDNYQDALDRGRIDVARRATRARALQARALNQARGERIATAKLTPEAVCELRRLAADGTPYNELARVYGVHGSTVARIVRRERWAHVS